ncbi:MAG: response regulator transcription factor [Armatimonadota bacterium]|nr:response regulator transcription factor [Armatimonadota bacterium]MDR7486331.1 response regulator transcription factor [Armatimonadota bacterium]MDR7532306.1 response regulator transcription factor [Armatimonadota bacterium]
MVAALQALLAREGYRVVVARDGPDAVDATRTTRPDLVLLDLALPGLDGVEVYRRIRLFNTVPVIMLTARATEGDKVMGLDVGADDYITKPFAPRELLATIRAQLRRAQQYAEAAGDTTLQVGDVAMDVAARVVVRGRNSRPGPSNCCGSS